MARPIMFVQLKTGYDVDRGPSWIGWVDFNRSRAPGFDSNFYDVATGDGAREAYEAFLEGAPPPGRERG